MPSGVEECGELSGNFTLFGDTLKSVAVAAAERHQLNATVVFRHVE